VAVIDDYGHHPTEIAVTLDAAKGMFPKGKLVAVIQPHRYTRLRDLLTEFATSAQVADYVVFLPVYAAGEAPIEGVSHEVLAGWRKRCRWGQRFTTNDLGGLEAVLGGLKLGREDVIVCLGAGSISGMAQSLGKRG